ncbi:MAG: 50S ribosomal protein L10 [Candidatus Levybacteria bacterium RIFCSPLOWO2_02_FULL_37_10]|nr:MAG: 50S ribosomal protein L10 [Candidatus Levybacteria bacterium RIFCSPHIGHO2_01_FULL_37_33]OGH16324.1 MAG: 50S ribosomal protein L10 [Candidatus Levybacteria bacterium RIFCSPHIGHO2_02_FULL_37_11]OGH29375.1 MAG: 50S ribosomal protein L10 [Candidatus Levybacteria bacterium RIFCSPHIGHO2_12_FULL_37_12]OGH45901.1 MAG: 50S ribosomal protein L10 [Candidatus Levybacteria bacterium RIFCSPLOWO2_02_FULL_37_10]
MNKISANRQKKEKIVQKLTDKIQKANSLVFTNYQGMTHKQLEELKKRLKEVDAEFSVTKNTLLKLALKSSEFGVLSSEKEDPALQNPTATLFVYDDVIAPLKQIAKTLKLLGLPTIKFGIIDNQALTGEQVLRIASLPSREVLISQLAQTLKSPIYRFHRALSWNMNKFVMTLSAVQQNKS